LAAEDKTAAAPPVPTPPDNQLFLQKTQPHVGRLLRRAFTFDNFVVGGSNNFAYSAALSHACRKVSDQSSLFLLSKSGMGKSHLSQAVGHQILSTNPMDRVYYITAEDFTNEMVSALKRNCLHSFKDKYRRGCDVLLLEDVHFLSGKEKTQTELAMTLDSLYESDKKIVFTSCYSPLDIPKMSDQLRSRLSCGLISNIDPPNFNTRVRILKKKARENGYSIPREVIEYLAGELSQDVRQLESGLRCVATKSSLLGTAVDLRLAESVVKTIVRNRKAITIDVIKKLVCKEYRITVDDIVSSSRKRNIVVPRQVAIYLSRRYTDSPLQAIGKSFNRYHATALHSIGAVERGIKAKGALHRQVEILSQKLESGKF
jgi:chromosomal replication initiator protein